MLKLKVFMLLIVTFLNFASYAQAKKITICSDDIEEWPFLILNNEEASGIYKDIIAKSLTLAKETSQFTLDVLPMPWNRCIEMVKKGQVDAALNISFNSERAEFIDFPSDAGKNEGKPCESKFKLYCGGYIVISMKDFPEEYNGDVLSLPQPIRIARGYSIAAELEKVLNEGLEIGKSDVINIKKLLRDKSGSVIAYTSFEDKQLFFRFKKSNEVLDQLKIHKKHYTMKSYYLAFSKQSSIDVKLREVIWKNINLINENKELLAIIYDEYLLTKPKKRKQN